MGARIGAGITARALAIGGLLAAVAVAAFLLISGDDGSERRLTAMFPRASFFFPGLDVRAAGQKVGEVVEAEVTPDDRAQVVVRIDDEAAWPLPEGTKAILRMGGTIKYTARYVQLDPPAKGDPLPAGAVISGVDTTSAVEFDEFLNTFDSRTRQSLKAMLGNGGAALDRARGGLRRSLEEAPPALAEARALIDDLGGDSDALRTLVRSGDRVLEAVNGSEPGAGELVSGAGTTLDAVATEARQLELALDRMPGALRTLRGTLANADGTLTAADELTGRLAPGVEEVRQLGAPLAGVLGTLLEIGPDARETLRTLRGAAPDLNPFLERTTAVMPRLGSIGRQAAKQVRCIRPYSPEIGAFGTTWISGAGTRDGHGYYLRAGAAGFPWPNSMTTTSGELNDVLPQVTIAFPRPPGQHVDEPWFQPECGITEDALDPDKDPEALAYDPLARPIAEIEDDEEDGG